jgi:hypothetical protein
MDWWTGIRLEVLGGESKKREILRREGISGETLKKSFGVGPSKAVEI